MEEKKNDIEEMCVFLLRKYPEMKFMDMNTRVLSGMVRLTGGSIDDAVRYMEDEGRCSMLAIRKVRRQREGWELDLLEHLEATYRKMMLHGKDIECSIIRELYFSKRSAFNNTKQHCANLDISSNTYYAARGRAERNFTLQADGSFSVGDAYNSVYDEMAEHEPAGIYYRDAERALKKYGKVRYAAVNDMLDETFLEQELDIAASLDEIAAFRKGKRVSGWMESSMMENTFAELLVIEEAVRQMRYFGVEGKEYSELLRKVYLEERNTEYTEDIIGMLGLTHRTYYQRRQKAIKMFSKILWGPLGHRHSFNRLF